MEESFLNLVDMFTDWKFSIISNILCYCVVYSCQISTVSFQKTVLLYMIALVTSGV